MSWVIFFPPRVLLANISASMLFTPAAGFEQSVGQRATLHTAEMLTIV